VQGCDAVIHVASVVDTGTVPAALIEHVNITGTALIVRACLDTPSVKALVYASSVDVVVANVFCHVDGAEEATSVYAADIAPAHHIARDAYSLSKTAAEKMVLGANLARPGLRTAAVRPTGMYGERDPVHVASVLTAARAAGRMNMFVLGHEDAVFQHVYVENCAYMHCLAAARLCQGDDRVAGQAFMGVDDTKVVNFFALCVMAVWRRRREN
jgi:nucleoside-diphosphate-sugar epimerase